MKPEITINGTSLTIAGFACNKVDSMVSEQTIDLANYAGEYIRIWLETDGTYSCDKHKDHYWQIAEFQMPEQQYKEIKDEDIVTKEPITRLEPIALDLENMEIETWHLPQ